MKTRRLFRCAIQRIRADDTYYIAVSICVAGEKKWLWWRQFVWHQEPEVLSQFESLVRDEASPVTWYDVYRVSKALKEELRPAWLAERYELLKDTRRPR